MKRYTLLEMSSHQCGNKQIGALVNFPGNSPEEILRERYNRLYFNVSPTIDIKTTGNDYTVIVSWIASSGKKKDRYYYTIIN